MTTEKWSATTRRCQMCGQAMGPRMHRQPHPVNGKQVCNGCAKLNAPEWSMTYQGMNKQAHDGGDGMDLHHCPFCGAGSVVGGADGTVTCQFCKKHFTVQVQPEFKAMPQTIDGQPYNIPGMPGGGPDAGAAPDQQQEDIEQAQQDAPPPGADDGTDHATDDDHDDDGASDDGGFPFNKKKKKPEDDEDKPIHQLPPHRMSSGLDPRFVQSALLITKEGIALPPDAYLQHLALTYADDRDQVLEQVKWENARPVRR